MIDDKKIEEAARDYINENGSFIKYDEDPCVDIEFAYRKGAKWAINEFLKDLWHSTREEPKKGRVFLYQTVNNTFGMNMIVEARDWKFVTKYQRATRWLYIDDLFPKKGDKQ